MLIDLWLMDAELGAQVAKQPWVVGQRQTDDGDRTRSGDRAILEYLRRIASEDVELARQMSALSWFGHKAALTNYVLISLYSLASRETDALSKLTSQPWFSDGLDEEEAALVVTLYSVASQSPDLYADLLRAHHTQSRAVTLPMAGDVNIWIFQNTPFPLDEDLPTIIEDTARIGEELLGAPFPTTDIILLIVDRSDKWYSFYSAHFDTHMQLARSSGGVRDLPHETAHYWFYNPRTGPRWLTEGAAEFIAAYVNDRSGGAELAYAREANAHNISTCVDYNQIENIRHLAVVLGNEWEITHPGS